MTEEVSTLKDSDNLILPPETDVDKKINKIARTFGKTMSRNEQYRIYRIRATPLLVIKKKMRRDSSQ
jgi:hypothetical protein